MPSKQSRIGERQTFSTGRANSVMSVSHFSFGLSAWKSLSSTLGTEGEISPLIRAVLSPSFGFYLKTFLPHEPPNHFPRKDDPFPLQEPMDSPVSVAFRVLMELHILHLCAELFDFISRCRGVFLFQGVRWYIYMDCSFSGGLMDSHIFNSCI